MVPVDVKPVRVTTTELKFSTFTVVNEMVALPTAETRDFSSMTLKGDKKPLPERW